MKTMLVILVGLMGVCAHAREERSDEDVRRILIGSTEYCHAKTQEAQREYALVCCGYDTNRLTRIMQDIVRSGDGVSSEALRWIGEYGTTNNLPFLYGCLTNAALGANAACSVLKIEGVTSNSVARIGEYLSLTNSPLSQRRNVGCDLICEAVRDSLAEDMRKFVAAKVVEYAKCEIACCRLVDQEIARADPSYRFSKRRLSVLRSAYALGVSQYQIAYVTNAINELVAYPEADLPE